MSAGETRILRSARVTAAAAILRAHGLVAIPTETVYGLAADATSDQACVKIYAAKGRARDNPLIVHVCSAAMLYRYTTAQPPYLPRLLRRFTPGPLTVILPKSAAISPVVTCGSELVAVRIPRSRIARRIIAALGRPLAAPSANRSGRLSPTTVAMVAASLGGRIDAIVDGGPCPVGVESTIIHAEPQRVVLLRPGAISLSMLVAALSPLSVVRAHAVTERTPGSHYRHYHPRSRLVASGDLGGDIERLLRAGVLAGSTQGAAHSPPAATPAIAVIAFRHHGRAAICSAAARGAWPVRCCGVVRTPRGRYRLLSGAMIAHPASLSAQLPSVPPRVGARGACVCYYYLCASNYECARVFYSLCDFFDQLAVTAIICALPTVEDAYTESLRDRISRAAATH